MNSINLMSTPLHEDMPRSNHFKNGHRCKTGLLRMARAHLVCLTAPLLALSTQFAGAQAEHITDTNEYTVRASVLKSEFIPPSVAREHNFEPAPDLGVLNVVVLKKTSEGENPTVPAAVIAYQRNLLGQRDTIDLRSVKQNDRISYLGTFEFDPSASLRFVVEAKPQGSEETITLEFKDRL